MKKEPVTIDRILGQMEDWVTNHKVIGPGIWLNAAQKLNVLLGNEHDELFDLQQKVAQEKVRLLESEETINVSAAKLKVEATDDYRDMCKLKAKIGRVEEFIRISKVQARLKDNEYKGY